MDYAGLYKDIYATEHWYGNEHKGRCPAVRLYPQFKSSIQGSKVVDLGCGRGGLVRLLQRDGFDAVGYDIIVEEDTGTIKHADFTKFMGDLGSPDTLICVDVLEHILEEHLPQVLLNLAKAPRVILTVHNGSSMHKGEDLHVTRWHMDKWAEFLEQRFSIVSSTVVARYSDGQQSLFVLDRR